MKGLKENLKEIGDSASTNETDFKRLKRRIEEVALGQKDPTLKSESCLSVHGSSVRTSFSLSGSECLAS